MVVILGAGLSGLSCSYHIGHDKCLILEKREKAFGHIGSESREGFTWDSGPHVSFTKHQYVRDLFEQSVDGAFDEYEVSTANYYKDRWIDHPAQSSLYQLPEPIRSQCLESFLQTRKAVGAEETAPRNYMEWLERAFGPVFARNFPAAYTRKYWTRDPVDMTTDWVGQRVFYPAVDDVVAGSKGPLDRQTHYITKIRYPKKGGYQSFAHRLSVGANIRYGAEVVKIDLKEKLIMLLDGNRIPYDKLINTLPLPIFIAACQGAPDEVIEAALSLSCSQLLLVNVAAEHPTMRKENWMYVYDEDKFSTRINCTEKLTPDNAPSGWTGVQVEVYFSRHKPLPKSPSEISLYVQDELVEMGLVESEAIKAGRTHCHTRYSPWANIIFDHGTRPALQVIWSWLEAQGLSRDHDDLHPLADWRKHDTGMDGHIFMAGRFAQWKYYWTDDCVLRGRYVANVLSPAMK